MTERDKMIIEYRLEIMHKKKALSETDYKCLKFAEGEISASEYAPTKEQRKLLRVEINALEEKINVLLRGK